MRLSLLIPYRVKAIYTIAGNNAKILIFYELRNVKGIAALYKYYFSDHLVIKWVEFITTTQNLCWSTWLSKKERDLRTDTTYKPQTWHAEGPQDAISMKWQSRAYVSLHSENYI